MKTLKKKLKKPLQSIENVVEYCGFIIAITFFRILPYHFARYLLVQLSLFTGIVLRIRRNVILSQLRLILPDKSETEYREIIYRLFKHLGYTIAEFFLLPHDKMVQLVTYHNTSFVDEALTLGRGLLIASGHFGNWENGGVYLAKKDRVNAIVKRQRNPYFDHYIENNRLQHNVRVIYKNNTLKPILAAIKKNEIIAFLIDQFAGNDGIWIPFVGVETSTFPGIAKIALKTKSPIIFCYDVRNDDGTHDIFFQQPILCDDLPYNNDNIRMITLLLNNKLSECILQYPHLWFWLHKRWRKH